MKKQERRQCLRWPIDWPVSVWSPDMRRFYNGRSVDVGAMGASIQLEHYMPVSIGATVEVNWPRMAELAHKQGQHARIRTSRVVRMNDTRIAVQFTDDCPLPDPIEPGKKLSATLVVGVCVWKYHAGAERYISGCGHPSRNVLDEGKVYCDFCGKPIEVEGEQCQKSQ